MQLVVEILKIIIKSKAGIIPVYIYDKEGIFEECMDSMGQEFNVSRLANYSKIALQNILRDKKFEKHVVIYSKFDIDIDSMLVAKRCKS